MLNNPSKQEDVFTTPANPYQHVGGVTQRVWSSAESLH